MIGLPERVARLVPESAPVRNLALLTLINTTGNGVFFTLSALYFTRILGFSVVSVGAGLSVAAFFGLAASVPFGHLSDRVGARGVLVATLVATGVMSAVLLGVQDYWQFVVVVALWETVDSGSRSARNAMIGAVVQGAGRAATRAYLRSITNVGMTVGTGIAALALHADTRAAYLVVMAINVASFFVCALVATRLPVVAGTTREEGSSPLAAVRDLPYVAVTLAVGVLAMHNWIVEIAIPLWVVGHTEAPRWMVSVLLVLNTVTVVAAQVAVARRVTTVRTAVSASVLSGGLLVVACALFGLSAGRGAVLASVLLVGAASVHVVAEMAQSAGSFLLGYDLAPEGALGQHQGLWAMGPGLAALIAPSLIAWLPLRLELPGWLMLGAILLVAGLAVAPAVRWAERTRGGYAAVGSSATDESGSLRGSV